MPEQHDRLIREAALLIPGYECNHPVTPNDFDRLLSGYRFTQTSLLRYTGRPGGVSGYPRAWYRSVS